MSKIYEKAILIRCSIGAWNGQVTDDSIIKTALAEHNMDRDAAKATKYLISKSALKTIRDRVNKIRKFHRDKTIPWSLKGVGLITNDRVMDYMTGMREHIQGFNEAVTQFIDHYDIYISDAQKRLGDRFDQDEFPNKAILKSMFGVSIDPMPIPKSDHILTDLTDTGLDKTAVDKAVHAAEAKAMQSIWSQIYARLNVLLDAANRDGRLITSTLTNLDESVTKLGDYNIYNNQQIQSFINFVEYKITSVDLDDVRKHPDSKVQFVNNLVEAITACKPYITRPETSKWPSETSEASYQS